MEILIISLLGGNILLSAVLVYLASKPRVFNLAASQTERPIGKMVQTPSGLFTVQSGVQGGIVHNSDEAIWEREQER